KTLNSQIQKPRTKTLINPHPKPHNPQSAIRNPQSAVRNPQSSLLWGVIPRSGPRGVIRLFDSDGEFAEGAVAFFVGRVESEHVLGAQLFGEAGEGPVELFQRHFIVLFARLP